MPRKSKLKTVTTPIVTVVAVLYFLIDAAFISIIRPIARRLARFGIFQGIARWIAARGPYTTLALFLVPVILLEPAKPVGLYFIASGHVIRGIAVIALGEVLKIAIIERIFDIGRPKLMTIRAFAWAFDFVKGWLDWLKALPPWQAVLHRYRLVVAWLRTLWRAARPTSH